MLYLRVTEIKHLAAMIAVTMARTANTELTVVIPRDAQRPSTTASMRR
jgi:hypothetical protein